MLKKKNENVMTTPTPNDSPPAPRSDASADAYTRANGEYGKAHPDWHVEDSPWKATRALTLLAEHPVEFNSVVEVGCGAGETLNILRAAWPESVDCAGYDIAHDAIALAKTREKPGLAYHLGDFFATGQRADLLLAFDVFEHVEDCYGFLRACRDRSEYVLFNIPLDLSVRSLLRPANLRLVRDRYRHLHLFCRESALLTMENSGFVVVGQSLGSVSFDLKRHGFFRRAAYASLRTLFGTSFAATLIGYHSLMVLAKG